jgi:hypothetical protein
MRVVKSFHWACVCRQQILRGKVPFPGLPVLGFLPGDPLVANERTLNFLSRDTAYLSEKC